jgi:DNA-binding MarR family transcriptional regulator
MGSNGSISAEDFVKSLHLLTHLSRQNVEERMVEQVTEGKVSFVQLNLMKVIGLHPGRTVGDVSRYMSVSYPAATKTVDKLVKLGYLRRKEDPNDRRIAHLHLTPAGAKVVEKYSQHKAREIQRVLDRFNREELQGLNEWILGFSRVLVDEIHQGNGCVQCGAFDPEICHKEGIDDCGYLVSLGRPKDGKA